MTVLVLVKVMIVMIAIKEVTNNLINMLRFLYEVVTDNNDLVFVCVTHYRGFATGTGAKND